jgi:hypothetical protein
MYDSFEEAAACPKGDIRLIENLDTGLVYNDAFIPDFLNYDSNYQNEQGGSLCFQQHLNCMAKVIQKTIGKTNLVEVGCGKGFFLEMLLRQGVDITGFDPTYEGNNSKIEKHYFEPGVGKIRANGIILRHVLEHIQDPLSFLMSLREANRGSGLIYIEVPCFDWICQNRAWFDVFYEHVNYFRLSDFYRFFGNVIESGRVFGDQYLYIVADLASLRQPVINDSDRVAFPPNFLTKLDRQKKTKSQIGTVIWGGGSKGVIFSLLKARSGQPVEYIIVINPSKQGRYIPSTGIRLISPNEGELKIPAGSTIYVMNPNYIEEIKRMSNYIYNYVII